VAGQPVTVISRAQEVAAQQAAAHQQGRATTFLVLGIALAYSLIAVAATMVMAGAGRRRELAALRLAGATRRQALAWAAAESLLAAALGAVVAGLAAAGVLAVQRVALTGLIGWFPVSVPWPQAGAVAGACAAIAGLAAVVTSARAMRGQVAELAGPGE
jgi:putative ABC transport system permease protein